MRHSTIDFEALRYLLVSAEKGKLGRAALELGIETGSLSRRVQRIEDELGLTLFERGHDGIRVTSGGAAVLEQARRVMEDFGILRAVAMSGSHGEVGQLRLGIRLPSVGEPIQGMLTTWRKRFPEVDLRLFELNEREIAVGMEDRRLDVALMAKRTLWPRAVSEPLYREALLAALPRDHRLTRHRTLRWDQLRDETFLVQGWDDSQSAREFYASLLGSGVRYAAHAASKQSVLGLVAAGFGVTLVTWAQAQVRIPAVSFRPILEDDAHVDIELVWVPENEDAVVGRFVTFMKDAVRGDKHF